MKLRTELDINYTRAQAFDIIQTWDLDWGQFLIELGDLTTYPVADVHAFLLEN